MHHLGHIDKLYLRTQISKDVSWCMYVCDCLCLPEQHQVVLLVHDDGAWGVLLALEGGGAQKGLSAMPHSWAKSQKPSKNEIFKKSLNERVISIPATVWQILNVKLMNDRKRKSSKSVETCSEKLVKSPWVNLIFGGFQPFENTVCRVADAAPRRAAGGSRRVIGRRHQQQCQAKLWTANLKHRSETHSPYRRRYPAQPAAGTHSTA